MLQFLQQHWQLVILVAALALAGIAVRSALTYRAELAASQLHLEQQRQLNDSTVARLASANQDRDAMHGLLIAKDKLQGKLIAGFVVKVPKRDTLVIHDTLVTTLGSDSTRSASFSDSTFAGRLTGTVTAPPCCAALQLKYQLTRPAFAPSVGFVQVGDKQVAVVTWQGEHVEIASPYADLPKAPHRFGTFVEGGVSFPREAAFARAGAFVRPGWNLSAFGAVEQTFVQEPARLQFGLRKEF